MDKENVYDYAASIKFIQIGFEFLVCNIFWTEVYLTIHKVIFELSVLSKFLLTDQNGSSKTTRSIANFRSKYGLSQIC